MWVNHLAVLSTLDVNLMPIKGEKTAAEPGAMEPQKISPINNKLRQTKKPREFEPSHVHKRKKLLMFKLLLTGPQMKSGSDRARRWRMNDRATLSN